MSGKGDESSASSVDLSRRDFQAMVYYDYCQRKSFQDCFQSLKHCFGDHLPSKATVFRWFRQFMFGERTLEDDDRCGRMATTVTPYNVSRVESLIKKYRVYGCLGVRKLCARWVPHDLSEEQKRGRVDWCTHMLRKFDGGRPPHVWVIVTEDET